MDFYNFAVHTRRTWQGGGLKGTISASDYHTSFNLMRFAAFGFLTNSGNNWDGSGVPSIWLPFARSETDSYGGSNVVPVYTGYPISYSLPLAPNDFAVAPCYESTLPVVGDTYVITAGVEEYEVLASAVGSSNGASKILLMVRTV
jgi:hypothetical protein